MACLAVAATALLFQSLDARYLWQDEAACAVLATRMMETGKPLGYDGRNLITMDEYRVEDAPVLTKLASDPEAMVQHFVEHGDFKSDTTWIGQPWGQFVLAGISMELFGKDTFNARLPFAIAGVLTVLLLFYFARTRFADQRIAWIAVALLLANTFWFLHTRQCRYYSVATFGLLATVLTYLRWRDGRRFGAALFVASGWLWFQHDFGSPWAVFGVMFFDALLRDRARWRNTVFVFATLVMAIAPFVFFYQMHTRVKASSEPWDQKFLSQIYNTNQYQLPILLALGALWILWREQRRAPSRETHLVGLCLAIIAAKLVWMPTVGPLHFYRYIVDLTPISAVVLAYGASRTAALVFDTARWQTLLASGLAGVQILSAVFSQPLAGLFPAPTRSYSLPGWVLRPELRAYGDELAGTAPDPNRDTIEYLRPLLRPEDEILVNYEDGPFIFYLRNRIRGGIPAFRALDTSTPTRFVVFRRTVPFIHRSIFGMAFAPSGEIDAGQWRTIPAGLVDITWGNNPDPGNVYSQLLMRRKQEWENTEMYLLESLKSP